MGRYKVQLYLKRRSYLYLFIVHMPSIFKLIHQSFSLTLQECRYQSHGHS